MLLFLNKFTLFHVEHALLNETSIIAWQIRRVGRSDKCLHAHGFDQFQQL
jgi:hypothetical protein